MADGGQDFNLGHVVGSAGEKGDDGSTVWNTSTAPSYANSKYTFTISNLSGKTGLQIAVNDIIFYSTYYYIVSAVNTTTVDCTTRISIKGSDASVTIVDNLTSTSSTSALSAKQGKVLNDNKIETSAIATSFGSTPSDSKVASEKLVKNSLDAKQATLVSGTNIKTVNNNSLLGSGNITIESGSDVDIVTSWEATLSDTKVPSEKLTKNTLDAKAPTSHASSSSTYGLGTTSNYGHVKTINGLTQSSHSDGTALSAYQGKVLKDAIDAKPDSSDIPTKTSDLTNDSNYISTSSTSGLIKNDGTIDTTSYSTFSGSYNDLSNKPTIPSASTTTPSADTTSGSYGSGTSYARSNHTHPKSSLYAESSHTHTVSNITDFPSIPSSSSDLSDGSDLVKKSSTTGLLKNDGNIDTNSYLTTGSASSTYQTKLVSGTSIKTINNESLLGSGNIIIQGGSSVDIVTAWESTPSDSKVASEKLTKDTLNLKVDFDCADGNNTFYEDDSLNGMLYLFNGSVDFNLSNSNLRYNNYKVATLNDIPSLSNYIQKSSTVGLVKNNGTIDTNSYLTTSSASSTYQPKLTSGTNIKTINNESLLGSGNITIQGGSSVDVVTSWEATLSDSKVPSEKLVKNTIDGLSIPTKTSDLTNDGDGTNVFVKNNDSRLTDARTPTSHTHGNLTNDGKVGSTANYFVYTTTGGAITSKQKIGNITTSGAIGSTSGLPIITTTSGVLTTGSFGTGSGTFAEGNHTHSNYISTSSTTGLIKNDGSIMTSGTGSTNYAAGNHTHSGYLSATKVTSWSSTVSDSNVPSEKLVKEYIDNQIGTAIQYIQQ